MTQERQVRVIIKGRVQGVWYRAWTMEEASELGLRGWVRNRRDGTVEAVFAGPPADIDRMLALCRQGPPLAQVVDISIHEESSPIESAFRQLPTA